MTDGVDKSGAEGVEEHVSPLSVSYSPLALSGFKPRVPGLLERLQDALHPYAVNRYPGKWRAMSEALCVSVGTIRRTCKPCGDAKLTLSLINRAEKVCAAKILELTAIQKALETRRLELTRTQAGKHRGMFQVRVRDDTGIPRTGLARDGWRKNKSPPTNF